MSNCRARTDDDGDLFYRTLRLVREVLAERAHWRIFISHQLWSHVDALPEPKQMVEGLTHYNIEASDAPLQAPVKAIASRKVYLCHTARSHRGGRSFWGVQAGEPEF